MGLAPMASAAASASWATIRQWWKVPGASICSRFMSGRFMSAISSQEMGVMILKTPSMMGSTPLISTLVSMLTPNATARHTSTPTRL